MTTTDMTTTLDDLLETFELLGDDWEERYRTIIALGRELPEMPAAEKVEANRVQGCQSTVWLTAHDSPTRSGALEFHADSDAHIVKGLVALLLLACSGKTPREILAFDGPALFARLGLDKHLSPTRSNGLVAMLKKIRAFAAARAA